LEVRGEGLLRKKHFLQTTKKKIAGASNVLRLINEFGKNMKEKSNKYVNVEN